MNASSRSMRVIDASLYFLPVEMRVPLKFGNQVLTKVICARACVKVEGTDGSTALGWGETPLSVGWVWPAPIDYDERAQALETFTSQIAASLKEFDASGHALDIGHAFIENRLEAMQDAFNPDRAQEAALPHLAALVGSLSTKPTTPTSSKKTFPISWSPRKNSLENIPPTSSSTRLRACPSGTSLAGLTR
jgi:hypothetical protein